MRIAGATKVKYTGKARRIARTICKKGRANARLFDSAGPYVTTSEAISYPKG